ncbi:MAG: FAD-binding protein [Candidatus Omnitrophica bacterium]|nr:FAD-binding protein [Candidatus Omnitrophota bacterium]
MIYHEAIVVGGGLAGIRAALELNRHNIKVAIISKVHPLRSHSIAAQGGVNAALGNHVRGKNDSWERHAFDTIKGSDYLADQQAVAKLVKDAPARVYELEHWGCPFNRTDEGKIAQRPFGGAGFPRTCYSADLTGHVMLHTYFQQLMKYKEAAEREEMTVYDEWVVTSLAVDDNNCSGIIALDLKTGNVEAFQAEAVILATGGAGRIYGASTNALINTGMGMSLAYRAGVPLKDMEFIQFHPTTLYGCNILITEGARGEGGYLINNQGKRFLADYPDSKKLLEVAPRDIVARNMTKEILAGRGFKSEDGKDEYLHLDLRHLGESRIKERLPGIRDISIKFAGKDPVYEPIPVLPAQHYTMGGIDCNENAETKVSGLYAAGECACVSVHGANRLGGNSLLETVVFGRIAGESAAKFITGKEATQSGSGRLEPAKKKFEEKLNSLKNSGGKEDTASIKEELGDVMKENAGIFRKADSLKSGLGKIIELKERYRNFHLRYQGAKFNYDLQWALELEGSIDVAEAVVAGALRREESRGSHSRTDFPKRDDGKWLKHTLATYTPAGAILSDKEVDLSIYPPKERKY